jgi:hypothetical protein
MIVIMRRINKKQSSSFPPLRNRDQTGQKNKQERYLNEAIACPRKSARIYALLHMR